MSDTPKLLPDDSAPTPRELPTVKLKAGHFFHLVRAAAAERAHALEQLAKKAADAGYLKESRAITADVMALKSEIVPAFALQTEIQADMADIKYAVMNSLRGIVRVHARPEDGKAKNPIQHGNVLLEAIGSKVEGLVLAVAEQAYAAGLHARQETPDLIAQRAVLRALTPTTP